MRLTQYNLQRLKSLFARRRIRQCTQTNGRPISARIAGQHCTQIGQSIGKGRLVP